MTPRQHLQALGAIGAGAALVLYGALPLSFFAAKFSSAAATVLFMGGLFAWYIPGILFSWTGFFTFVEFGANPNGWPGRLLAWMFWTAVGTGVYLLAMLAKRRAPVPEAPPPRNDAP